MRDGMVRPRTGKYGLALAGAAVLALASAAVPASGATSTSWRVVTDVGTTTGRWSTSLSVSGPDGAWSVWTASTAGGVTIGYVVERWNGKDWTQVEVPASLTKQAEASVAFGASSADDAWLIDAPGAKFTRVLRWTGSTWVKWAIPYWALVWNETNHYSTVPVLFSPKDVWIFSLGPGRHPGPSEPGEYAARYNGSKWTTMSVPVIPGQISAISPDDIWALGSNGRTSSVNSAYALVHWTGHQWLTAQLPKTLLPYENFRGYLAALGRSDAWIAYDAYGAVRLLNWNGRSWRQVTVPAQVSAVDGMAQDGHGGLWLTASGPQSGELYFAHLSGGKWTVQAVPAGAGLSATALTGITWIPGTRSVWATATYSGPSGSVGAVLKYGP